VLLIEAGFGYLVPISTMDMVKPAMPYYPAVQCTTP